MIDVTKKSYFSLYAKPFVWQHIGHIIDFSYKGQGRWRIGLSNYEVPVKT